MQTNSASQPNSGTNRNLIIGIIIAIVLCCCCIVTGIVGYYGYQAYVQAQQVVEDLQDFEVPTAFPNSADPNNPAPEFDLSGEIPEGGLAEIKLV
jgi:flagellar basal body-associated protein FliL